LALYLAVPEVLAALSPVLQPAASRLLLRPLLRHLAVLLKIAEGLDLIFQYPLVPAMDKSAKLALQSLGPGALHLGFRLHLAAHHSRQVLVAAELLFYLAHHRLLVGKAAALGA
jgi:hypothetical protein